MESDIQPIVNTIVNGFAWLGSEASWCFWRSIEVAFDVFDFVVIGSEAQP